MKKLNFNFIRDIAPVAGIVRVPNVMLVNPSVPAKTVPEFIAYAKSNPGKVNMASPGVGTSVHLSGELFGGGADLSRHRRCASPLSEVEVCRGGLWIDTFPASIRRE